jgi:hypothetical protein
MFREGHSYMLKPEYKERFKHHTCFALYDFDIVSTVFFVSDGNAAFKNESGGYLLATKEDFHCFEEVFTQETALKYVFENCLNLSVEQEWCSNLDDMLVRYKVYSPYCSAISDWGVDMVEQLVQAVTLYDAQMEATE